MGLLSADDRLPHLFGLRAERPVYRYGVIALAALAAVLLVAVGAATDRLIPLYAIGVFIGFTISQTGLVRHWYRERPRGWAPRAALNGVGAALTAIAAAVFVLSKFTSGAWGWSSTVPALMLLFSRVECYYRAVGLELGMGRVPDRPLEWDRWDPGVRLDIVESPHWSLVRSILKYVQQAQEGGRQIAVPIPEAEPRAWRYRILQNQRGLLLATALRARTDVVACTLPYRLVGR